MRLSKACGLGGIALTLAVAGCASGPGPPRAAPGVQLVNIRVMCPAANNISIAVTPAQVSVRRNRDSVSWSVIGNGTQATIAPKTPGFWPFASQAIVVTPGQPTNSGRTVANTETGTYPYNVAAICQVPNGPAITITVDPDVIITEDE